MKIFEFINHASIKIVHEGSTVVTDPWYMSNSFGGWYQSPSPEASQVYDIVDSCDNLAVIVSHGHDDHLDEFFIETHLSNANFYCSKFGSPALENRLKKLTKGNVTTLENSAHYGSMKIEQFINPDFTHYDAIIGIKTKDFIILHANDNWHEWPASLLDKVLAFVEGYPERCIYLLIQFGVADCFPLNYPNISDKEMYEIIETRFVEYYKQTQANAKNLNLKHIYYYANQSKYKYGKDIFSSLFVEAQDYIEAQVGGIFSHQLMPAEIVEDGHFIVQPINNKQDIFSFQLGALEKYINTAYRSKAASVDFIKTKFLDNAEAVDANCVNYVADRATWNRILIGELTLEAITIGGCGMIYKPAKNISKHHQFISKQAYIIQNSIKKSGLSFYREMP